MNLSVFEFEGELVVDSRLVAPRLGIEHESFMRTVDNHKTVTEQAFGAIRFQIGSRQDNNSGGKQPRWAYLTEDQATFLMTLSRNTTEVIQCKIDLVTAFSNAKKLFGAGLVNPPTPAEMLLGMAQQMVDQERRLKESESQLNSLIENQKQAESELKALPEASTPAPVKTSRAKVVEIVRNYVVRTNASYQEVWRKLYHEVSYRCHYNAVQRAKNRGVKPMDVIEQDGKIDDLFAIACELLK